MKANPGGAGLIEIERLDGLLHVGAQFLPGVPLGDYALGWAFRTEATILFLHNFENDFHAHTFEFTRLPVLAPPERLAWDRSMKQSLRWVRLTGCGALRRYSCSFDAYATPSCRFLYRLVS